MSLFRHITREKFFLYFNGALCVLLLTLNALSGHTLRKSRQILEENEETYRRNCVLAQKLEEKLRTK